MGKSDVSHLELVGVSSDDLSDLITLLEEEESGHSLDSYLGSNVLYRAQKNPLGSRQH